MSYPSTAAAIGAARILLSDGPTDKLAWRKKVLGDQTGTGAIFKTFEQRRVTNFTVIGGTTGLFLDNVAIACLKDDPESGEFTLSSPPSTTSTLEATYYYQFFNDSELDSFLQSGSLWLGFSTNYIAVPDGLNPALIHYAGLDAFHKLAVKLATRASSTYRTEDAPKKEAMEVAKTFSDLAKDYEAKAIRLRDDFYSRQGRSKQAAFATVQPGFTTIRPLR